MKKNEPYAPDWRNEDEIAAWLGVDTSTLFRWRTKYKLAYTHINNRTVCYDKKQIIELLNRNSTYAVLGDVQLLAQ